MATTANILYHFATFTMDLTRGALNREGAPCKLRRQSFDVLRFLIERRGTVVSGADILAAVWPQPPAKPDDSLKHCIADIRRTLGDDSAWIIRTVSGAGYEFMPEVTIEERAEPAIETNAAAKQASLDADRPPPGFVAKPRLWLWAGLASVIAVIIWLRPVATPPPAAATSQRSTATLTMLATPNVAIMPASGTPSPSIADDMATELRRTPRGYDLTIIPPASGRDNGAAADAAGRKLGVRYVVTTALRDDGDARQALVQLIEAPTGRQLWAAPFRTTENGLQAQTLLAARISREIAVQIRTSEHARPLPEKLEAGHYTLQGRVLLESERDADVNARAMVLFDKAVALEPKHIQSLLGYARTRVVAVLGGSAGPDEARLLTEAEQAVSRAIAIDATTVGAHLLRGSIERVKGNFDRAAASFEHARSLNPNYAFAHAELGRTMLDMGRPDACLAHIRDALVLSPTDPVSANWHFWAGMASAQLGDAKASLDWMLKARQINTRNGNPRPWIAIAYARLGETAKAHAVLAEHLKAQPKFSIDAWQRNLARDDRAIAARLAPFAKTLRDLGAPDRS